MRNISFYPLLVFVLVGLAGYLGCDPSSIRPPAGTDSTGVASSSPLGAATVPEKSPATILIGSFNLQRLGPSKLADPWVMERFAEIIRRFDVIALQEITSKDQQTLPLLVQQVNRLGAAYDYAISPRIGRESTGYFEQYAYLYDARRIEGGQQFSYKVEDAQDLLHREPFVARFRAINQGAEPFGFTLVNIHTDPDEVAQELDVLADVLMNVRQYEYPQDDVILLGDLNAEPGQMRRLEQLPTVTSLIRGIATNTRKSKALDNILVDGNTTTEFTGRFGVVDLEQMFRIDRSQVDRISDHLPVWAEFTVNEQPTASASVAGVGRPIVR